MCSLIFSININENNMELLEETRESIETRLLDEFGVGQEPKPVVEVQSEKKTLGNQIFEDIRGILRAKKSISTDELFKSLSGKWKFLKEQDLERYVHDDVVRLEDTWCLRTMSDKFYVSVPHGQKLSNATEVKPGIWLTKLDQEFMKQYNPDDMLILDQGIQEIVERLESGPEKVLRGLMEDFMNL